MSDVCIDCNDGGGGDEAANTTDPPPTNTSSTKPNTTRAPTSQRENSATTSDARCSGGTDGADSQMTTFPDTSRLMRIAQVPTPSAHRQTPQPLPHPPSPSTTTTTTYYAKFQKVQKVQNAQVISIPHIPFTNNNSNIYSNNFSNIGSNYDNRFPNISNTGYNKSPPFYTPSQYNPMPTSTPSFGSPHCQPIFPHKQALGLYPASSHEQSQYFPFHHTQHQPLAYNPSTFDIPLNFQPSHPHSGLCPPEFSWTPSTSSTHFSQPTSAPRASLCGQLSISRHLDNGSPSGRSSNFHAPLCHTGRRAT